MNVLDLIFCDDIRHELGGKLTLVGVYADAIVVATPGQKTPWPAVARLGAYLRIVLSPKTPIPDGFKLQFRINGNVIATAEGPFGIKDPAKPIAIAAVNPGFPLAAAGLLECRLILTKNREDIETFDVGRPLRIEAAT